VVLSIARSFIVYNENEIQFVDNKLVSPLEFMRALAAAVAPSSFATVVLKLVIS
jgi:hypothetical protein